jgi:tetratricopeptide (TPR) repeat protein
MRDCPYCGYPVIDRQAVSCASCGYRFRRFSKMLRPLCWAVIAAVGIGAGAYLFFAGPAAKPVAKRSVRVPSQAETYAVTEPPRPHTHLYADFLQHYRVKTDPRFRLAVAAALDLSDAGRTLPDEGRSRPAVSITPKMGFAAALTAMEASLQRSIPVSRPPDASAHRSDQWWTTYRLILSKFNQVDARSIIAGLLNLEALYNLKGPDARLHLAAARGYALLKMGMYADYMQRSDAIGVLALAHLILARHMDPTITATREEALVAMTLGYRAHAIALREKAPADAQLPGDRLIDAYIREDIAALKSASADGEKVLKDYLLMRLYRELGLYNQAEDVALKRARKASDHYPTVVELIYSGDLSIAKMLTEYYPMALMTYTRRQISGSNILMEAVAGSPWLKALLGVAPQLRPIPRLVRFDETLERWRPLEEGARVGRFIDARRIKTIFRTLFEGALSLRFHLLLKQWGVVDKADHYLQRLSEGDANHPLALLMAVELAAEKGQRDRVQTLFKKMVSLQNVPARILLKVYSLLQDDATLMNYISRLAQGLDGRPEYLKEMGYLLSSAKNESLACQFFTLAQAHDPSNIDLYYRLARLRGSPEPLQQALTRYPGHFEVLEVAGDFYAEQPEKTLKTKAITLYDEALKLAPTRTRIWRSKVKVLRELKRYKAAAETLESWLSAYGRGDLTETIMRARLGRVYLDMGLPQKALTVIEPTKNSYQAAAMVCLARTYEALGRPAAAEELLNKAIGRYPTAAHLLADQAGFYWRQGRFREAAACIAKGHHLKGSYSRWYFDAFMEVFGNASPDRIIAAVHALTAGGTDGWDIEALALRYAKQERQDLALVLLDQVSPQHPVDTFVNRVTKSEIVQRWRGEAAAAEILAPYLKAPLSGGHIMYFFEEGMYPVLLKAIGDPDLYPPKHREFVWLIKLVSWLACAPAENAGTPAALQQHYAAKSVDHYHAIGRYLLGTLSREELLERIKTPRQVCEAAYYLGFGERLAGHFDAAANWYQICLETGLQRNGEYHWALNELNLWALLGVDRRHRRLKDDEAAYDRLYGAI